MNAIDNSSLLKLWQRIATAGGFMLSHGHAADEQPLRSELLSADQMEQFGVTLATAHQLAPGRASDWLLTRLTANENALISACNLLTEAVVATRPITPAGEWLLDNFHLIEEQMRTARRHLPKGYSRELPRLARGPSKRLPRVYDIALQTISHGDGRVDPDSLARFVAAYQTVTVLTLGELWAIPIMLRLALIENLRRVSARIAAGLVDRNLADFWADQMTVTAEQDPKSLILLIADMARSNPPMSTAFVAEFARRLQGQGAALALALTWVEQLLAESHQTIEQFVQSESQRQASAQVSISNSIASLRFLGAMDWREFVESMSRVESTLRGDPSGVYGHMDFSTRDVYRHAIETMAKSSDLAEHEIAERAVQLAREAAANTADRIGNRMTHVGYYLIDKGLPALEHAAEVRTSRFFGRRTVAGKNALRPARRQRFLFLYPASIALITLVVSAALIRKAQSGALADGELLVIGIVSLLAATQLAVALTNWLATLLVSPSPLPRMDFSRGIPATSRTLVIIPTMLTNAASIDNLVEALEVRFLANRDANLHFGLLTDFRDASQEMLAGDDALLQRAVDGISALNEKYAVPTDDESDAAVDGFFLFHRPRCWNAQESIWMGYERKRGKLADLNALLRGGCATNGSDCFSRIVGDTAVLQSVAFVITLDTDTALLRDAARQFVATIAHPLNRAVFDAAGRVTDGYSILQPRMAVSVSGTNRSRYARLFGADAGIDPYTRAVSDVYQDVFGEGSFIGKGIYDVDAFERALKSRFPENRILSHDLLEGCYARSALMSDVQLYEDYPASYRADVSRRHRWIRGDWQIAGWLLSQVPVPRSASSPGRNQNPLSLLSQWKIFDNLRRSLLPAALLTLLLLGWARLDPAGFWTLVVIGVTLLPPLIGSVVELFRKPNDVSPGQHLAAVFRSVTAQLAQAAFSLACLPFETYCSLDAIICTHWRILVSKKRLLEWMPSSDTGDAPDVVRNSLATSFRLMWAGPFVSAAAMLYLAYMSPSTLWVAGPILFLWIASPAIAWWISRVLPRREAQLSGAQLAFLTKNARKTWAFFEIFVGPDDHWLPPDNFQEHPANVIAHRTSPTNIGLALLANLSAYDFGYITGHALIERCGNTLDTMAELTQYQGHLYNWYDTETLMPLAPLYISSVDSGNLAGHLLTLRAGLLALPDDAIFGARVFEGLADTLGVLSEHTTDAPTATRALMDQLSIEIEIACETRPATLSDVQIALTKCRELVQSLVANLNDGAPEVMDAPLSDAWWWANALTGQCRAALDELEFFAPWLALSATIPTATGGLQEKFDLNAIRSIREVSGLHGEWLIAIEHYLSQAASANEREWLHALRVHIGTASRHIADRLTAIETMAQQVAGLADMNYDFLYDKRRHLLSIGYNVAERRQDTSFYDMLASESRLANFVAIAQGKLPQESWFALGRLLTPTASGATLLSWSGSMFEYLMPLLIMPTYKNTLLDDTYRASVKRQIAYGNQCDVPWGISESGYNTVDAGLNYQYRAFGVPGLGLKRGLAEDLVITPYASALALMVAPEAACRNLQRLGAEGLAGKFGFYEAIDFTAARLPRGQTSAVIRSFMAHHQGMILLSLAYLLLNRPMQKRFESDPMFQATTPLLQERVPRASAFQFHSARFSTHRATANDADTPVRVIGSPNTPIPEVQLLSNRRYHVMVTNSGGGYSRWKDLAVTRWREDTTCDNSGTFCYIRDVASGAFWSNTHQPTLARAQSYEAIFSEGRAEFRRRDDEYETHTEIVVSPEDDIELRRVRITNRARSRRDIEVTSYAEVVLATPAADALHPAFSNLFVQSEIIAAKHAILCTRRRRSQEEAAPWMFHLMVVHGAKIGEVSYETSRLQFIGRGNSVAAPQCMIDTAALSCTAGSVLDPIVAIRYRITLEAEQSVTIDMVTGVGETREAAVGLIDKYQDRRLANRVFELAWTHSQVALRQINATEADAQIFSRLANSVIHANASLRADPSVLVKNRRGQSGLWGYAISGDLPIVLLRIGEPSNIDLVRQLVQAHAYWRLKGLVVDLVIWNEDRGGYRQQLQEQIIGLISTGIEAHVMDRPGGIFVRSAEHISDEDRILFESVARVILSDRRGPLADQISRRGHLEGYSSHLKLPRLKAARLHLHRTGAALAGTFAQPDSIASAKPDSELLFHNGLGGFSTDGREYVITTTADNTTPAPWVNVLANPHFGSVISESGMAYTWSENAHEFRLTPWHNDPVADSGGEAFYLRDEETGHYWSPAPLPCRGAAPYVTRHGFGYSIFEHVEDGIRSMLTVYVALDAAIRFSVLKIVNESGRARRLSVTGYVEWVLGDLKPKSTMHVITEIDPQSGAVFARNAYNSEFAERIAFFDVDDIGRTVCGDRAEFIGRNGNLARPAAMTRTHLSNKVGAGLDPCAAIQVAFDLADGEQHESIFRLGAGRNLYDARKLQQSWRGAVAAHDARKKVRQYWQQTLGAVQIETPDAALNVLTNGWLLYQTLACRIWARSGYYQSGGAFGFRDQLQDAMALIHTEPQRLREQVLLCAGRQFREGDVQHWWHPPGGRGVRTHCSDDYLWLPLATCRYVLSTGDTGVLNVSLPFLEGRAVNAGDDSYYDLPRQSDEAASLYQHCVRAILHGLTFGARGLPLIGSGDWNDGMNLVGKGGKGESVWLAFFLCEVLRQFNGVARIQGDIDFAERCVKERAALTENIEKHGWDGAWYRRAFFDDGKALGSAANDECQIDSIAQSWSVLSGAGKPERSRAAMDALDARLVRRADKIIQLLDPPFDRSAMDPGYIKGYVPGIRENGGQYTHGAIWAAMAFAAMGDSTRAWELTSMINPINHARAPEEAARYKVEPYVIAADVYALAPHTGRGGWSWYTGSAGWMYRLIVESLLGLRLDVDKLHISPCIPADWPGYTMHYRYRQTVYRIVVTQQRMAEDKPIEKPRVTVDGVVQKNSVIALMDDRQDHAVAVEIWIA